MRDPFIVSRRRLLQSAGGVFAAAAFRPELGLEPPTRRKSATS